ncbi:MAG: DHCW motif cupin fold protein [Ignavibacteria bacterium]|jgi:quercetin dioxygenase-like cupin family protein
MKKNIPLLITDWDSIPKIEFKGEKGVSYWRTMVIGGIRMRIVDYSQDFIADHWCEKGHIVYCIEGEITIKLKDEKLYPLKTGMSFILSDNTDSHLVLSEKGAKVFIVDGDFFK